MLKVFLQTCWLLLTYSYNIVLVLFIATHLFVGAIISFLTGMYMGVYLTQNFEVPRISHPRQVWEKLLQFLEKHRKDPNKVSLGNVLRPSTIRELVSQSAAASDAPIPVPTTGNEEADDDPDSPSKTEGLVVPQSRHSAIFVEDGSQTELEISLFSADLYDDEPEYSDEEDPDPDPDEDQITTESNFHPDNPDGDEPGVGSGDGDRRKPSPSPTRLGKMGGKFPPSDPITDNVTTLILTGCEEDMTGMERERYRRSRSPPPSPPHPFQYPEEEILEVSLTTLDKDNKAISDS